MTDADVEALTAELRNLAAEVRALRESWRCAKAPKPRGEEQRAPAAYSPAFEEFWDAYACVRRRNKPAAWQQWQRLSLGKPWEHDVMAALADYQQSEQWKSGYMPEPARWLKSEPWLDEPVTPEAAPTPDPWEPKR